MDIMGSRRGGGGPGPGDSGFTNLKWQDHTGAAGIGPWTFPTEGEFGEFEYPRDGTCSTLIGFRTGFDFNAAFGLAVTDGSRISFIVTVDQGTQSNPDYQILYSDSNGLLDNSPPDLLDPADFTDNGWWLSIYIAHPAGGAEYGVRTFSGSTLTIQPVLDGVTPMGAPMVWREVDKTGA